MHEDNKRLENYDLMKITKGASSGSTNFFLQVPDL